MSTRVVDARRRDCGTTDLQPVCNVGVELADMPHAVIEDNHSLRGRESVLQQRGSAEGAGAGEAHGTLTSNAGYSLRWRSIMGEASGVAWPRGERCRAFT
jgi:hypothetical protein